MFCIFVEIIKKFSLDFLITFSINKNHNLFILLLKTFFIFSPSFDRDVYSITSVPEDTAPGTIIATVSASDTDTGVNGMVNKTIHFY